MKRESGASNTSEAMTVPSNTAHGARHCDTSPLDYSLEKLWALVSSDMPPLINIPVRHSSTGRSSYKNLAGQARQSRCRDFRSPLLVQKRGYARSTGKSLEHAKARPRKEAAPDVSG